MCTHERDVSFSLRGMHSKTREVKREKKKKGKKRRKKKRNEKRKKKQTIHTNIKIRKNKQSN
jgi:hypothetical protein